MRQFIRVKYTFAAGGLVWLTSEGVKTGLNAATTNRRMAHRFANKREAYSALLELGGRWLNGGKLVHVRARPKLMAAS